MPRRSKRVRQIAEEAGVLQEEEATKAAFEHLEDRSLFFVDTGALWNHDFWPAKGPSIESRQVQRLNEPVLVPSTHR